MHALGAPVSGGGIPEAFLQRGAEADGDAEDQGQAAGDVHQELLQQEHLAL